MKLLMISGDHSLVAGKRGAFYQMLEEFSKHWERIDILCPRTITSGEMPDPAPFFGKVYVHVSPVRFFRHPWWILKKGAELFLQEHHDVMTVHEYPPFQNGIGAAMLSRRTGIPYVTEIHHVVGDPVASSWTESIGRLLSWLLLPMVTRRAAKIRTVNEHVRDLLVAWGLREERLAVVPSFYLDTGVFAPRHANEPSYDLVCAARFVGNKGLMELLSAVEQCKGVTLLLIGDGPLRKSLERRARALRIADRVTFAGWLPDVSAVANALNTARVFVMNSKSEGGPRSALEALASGLPVITTRVGVMPDILREGVNGLFTTGDAHDLAEKIRKLCDDESLRTAMAERAPASVAHFDKIVLIRRYAEFLQSLRRSV